MADWLICGLFNVMFPLQRIFSVKVDEKMIMYCEYGRMGVGVVMAYFFYTFRMFTCWGWGISWNTSGSI